MIHDQTELKIPVGNVVVEGTLTLPPGAKGVVLFAHGSGSGRFSPRNQYVAKEFNKATIGTLLFDLAYPRRGRNRHGDCRIPFQHSVTGTTSYRRNRMAEK